MVFEGFGVFLQFLPAMLLSATALHSTGRNTLWGTESI